MLKDNLKRNRYSDPPFSEGEFSARHFDEDFNEFHLPLTRLQLANFQDWGVANGLEVIGLTGNSEITVNPGTAVDGQGQFIALSSGGTADTGSNPLNEEHNEVEVPVIIDLKRYAQPEGDSSYYVTIQFSEILRFEQGPLGRFEHVPWVRLRPVTGEDSYVNDGSSIVLARIVVSSEGNLAELSAQDRRLVGKTVSELVFRRPLKLEDQVQQGQAGKIAPKQDGGLQISVAESSDGIDMISQNGDSFAHLDIHAKDVTLRNNLKISGNLEVQGDVIARDTEHVAGNVMLGDQDQDEIKIAGVIRSQHSSGALQIDDALRVSGKLTTQDEIGIGSKDPDRPLTITARGDVGELLSCKDSDGKTRWHLNLRKAGFNLAETGVADARVFVKQGGNVGIGTDNPKAKLQISGGAIMPAQGKSENSGILFPKDPFGGGGDRAWIRYYARRGENTTFEIGTSNDRSDHIALMPSGRVGIATTDPKGKLDVHGNVRIRGAAPIQIREYENANGKDTGYAVSGWEAAIVGFRSGSGDINENDSGTIMRMFMENKNGRWHIQADFRSHRRHESWWVRVMFIKRELVG